MVSEKPPLGTGDTSCLSIFNDATLNCEAIGNDTVWYLGADAGIYRFHLDYAQREFDEDTRSFHCRRLGERNFRVERVHHKSSIGQK